MAVYVDELRRRRLPWLHRVPVAAGVLASYIIDNRIDLRILGQVGFDDSESLLPHQVVAIERAFGVRPIQHYAMTESVASISECERGCPPC